MRPAPPASATGSKTTSSPPPSTTPRRTRLIVGGCVAVAAAALVIVLLMLRSGDEAEVTGPPAPTPVGGGNPSGSPTPSPTVPARPPFVFRIDEVNPVKTEQSNAPAANDAAIDMAGRLSSFYDVAFLDPETWTQGLPDSAWNMFDDSVVKQAKKDADSLTLGDQAAGITSLQVDETSLAITVLLDPAGQPDTAVAEVSFSASGIRDGGESIEVTNSATFLFDQVGGSWVVIGYPNAKTTVSSVEPSASPQESASGSPSAGASP
jgi:hypothetical protein